MNTSNKEHVYGVTNSNGVLAGNSVFKKEKEAIERAIDMTHKSFRDSGIADRIERIERNGDSKEYLKQLQTESVTRSYSVKEMNVE